VPSAFSGIEIALRALRAQQAAIEVINHNIANVNTDGYSRQKAILATTDPYTVPAINREESYGQVGTGVEVQSIRRYTSEYLNAQMRGELSREGRWEVLESALGEIEVVFREPSDSGISSALSQFWRAWSDLAAVPEELAARTAVAEAASHLAYAIGDASRRLEDLRSDMDSRVRQMVDRINDIAVEIAALNDPISKVQAFGDQPNDLRDRRDALLDELSEIVNINYMENLDGTVTVQIGGHALVMGVEYSQLVAQNDSTNGMMASISWTDSGTPLIVRGVALEGQLDASSGVLVGGQLGGAVYTRDVLIAEQLDTLDTMASELITSVNKLHATGFGMPDDSVDPPDPRPGSAISSLTTDPAGPVTNVLVDGSTYSPDEGLGAGWYSIETRDNGGIWEFRVLDWNGDAVEINSVSGGDRTDDWQALAPVLGTTYDTGRGFAIEFAAAPGAEGEVASFQYLNFFSGSTAANIEVSDWVRSEPLNVATAATGNASGDGSVARAIAGLRTTAVVDSEYSLDEFYEAAMMELGLSSRQAMAMKDNAETLIEHLRRSKDSESAVDLDEETVNLIQYQRAYQGAARALSVVDEMLDRLINRTGLVGR